MCNLAANTDKSPVAARDTLENHVATITSPDQLLDKILVCKFRTAWDKKTTKVFFAVHHRVEKELDALLTCIVAGVGKIKRGQPPQGGLAKQLQQQLERLTEMIGDERADD